MYVLILRVFKKAKNWLKISIYNLTKLFCSMMRTDLKYVLCTLTILLLSGQFITLFGQPIIEIRTPQELHDIRNDLNADYILMNDIDLAEATGEPTGAFWNDGNGWEPIGDTNNPFTGILDGGGNSITGLQIDRGTEEFVGLFSAIDGATIQNLTIDDAEVNADGEDEQVANVSILAGQGLNFIINNLTLNGKITATTDFISENDRIAVSQIGGLVAFVPDDVDNEITINQLNFDVDVKVTVKRDGADIREYDAAAVGGLLGKAGDRFSENLNVWTIENVEATGSLNVDVDGRTQYLSVLFADATNSNSPIINDDNFDLSTWKLTNINIDQARADVSGNGPSEVGLLGGRITTIWHLDNVTITDGHLELSSTDNDGGARVNKNALGVGEAGYNWEIKNSGVTGEFIINGDGDVSRTGLFIGQANRDWTITDSWARGTINITSDGDADDVGLFIGDRANSWEVTNSHAEGEITILAGEDAEEIGIFAGSAGGDWNLTNSWAKGDINITAGLDQSSSNSDVNEVAIFAGASASGWFVTDSWAEGNIRIENLQRDVEEIAIFTGDTGSDWVVANSYATGDITIDTVEDVENVAVFAGKAVGNWKVENTEAEGDLIITTSEGDVDEVAIFTGGAGIDWEILNTHAKGDVTINAGGEVSEVAVFLGYSNSRWDITDSSAEGDINITAGTHSSGRVDDIGIFAGNPQGTYNFNSSTARGDITITNSGDVREVGIFAGDSSLDWNVIDSNAEGDITIVSTAGDVYEIGVFVGDQARNSTFTNTYAKGNIDLTAARNIFSVGVYFGDMSKGLTIENSYALGNITANAGSEIFGLGIFIGNNSTILGDDTFISGVFSSGNITANTSDENADFNSIGGFIGYIGDYRGDNLTLKDVYSYGNVNAEGASAVGGLIGRILDDSAAISNAYAAGEVTGGDDVGGLVGLNDGNSNIENSFFDKTLNPGMPDAPDFGITTEQMRQAASFTGFDFDDVWQIETGSLTSFPYLRDISYDEPGALPEINPIPGLLGIIPNADNVVFVNQGVEGGNGFGNSWDNAIPELRDALNLAQDWDAAENGTLQIWVAEGLYLPTDDDEDRETTFQLVNHVEIYGGFAGGETERGARNWNENLTILSGDINGSEDLAGNSYTVVTGSGTNNTAVIDGFTITMGNADGDSPNHAGGGMYNVGGSPTITNIKFSGNAADFGGAMLNNNESSPVVTNCTFSQNSADFGGGMLNDNGSSPVITNCIFSGNIANNFGGGIAIYDSNTEIINSVFTGNSAENLGGAILNFESTPTITNTIIWNNTANEKTDTPFASVFNDDSTPVFSYSLIANSGGSGDDWVSAIGEDGGNNIDADPLFADPDAGDFRLTEFSPAINVGTNAPFEAGGVAEGITTDLDGNDRIFGGTVDMGAYEFQSEPGVVPGGEDRRVLVSNASDEYIFTRPDFSVDETVSAVKIETIAGGGTLLLDGETVDEGDVITSEQLENGELVWIPDAGEHGYGYASFVFRLINEFDVESTEEATLFIDLAATSVTLSGGKGWRFLTSPSQGDTFEDFLGPVYVQGVSGSDNPGAQDASLYILNQEEYRWELPDGMSDEITPDRGFIVFGFEDDMPQTLTSGENWLPLDGFFDYEYLFFDPGQGEDSDSHFLLGNPHPISLDFCAFDRLNVAGNIQIWDPTLNDGDYLTLSCANGGAEIAPFQAYWIRTLDERQQLQPQKASLEISQRPELVITEEAYLSSPADGYFKQAPREDLFAISLNLREDREGFTNDVQILFSEEGTTGLDEWDAPKLSARGLAPRWLSFYALDEDSRAYAIRSLPAEALAQAGLPDSFDGQLTIPLHVETTQAGSYTLSWELPSSEHYAGSYYLRDTHTGSLTELTAGQTYRFDIDQSMAAKDTHSPIERGSSDACGDAGVCPWMPAANASANSQSPRFELILSERGLHEENNLPTRITLNQNYPNPFNPSTIISYELPEQAHVRLSVYDMTGRQVATLVNEQVSAGTHQVSFNAMNLSSGVYMYRLQAGGTVLSRQLTLIK